MEPLVALGGLTTLYIASKKNSKYNKKLENKAQSDYTQKREKSGFSKSIQNSINLITINKNTVPVGSYKYKVHAYPSDIDIFEIVKKCCSLNKLQSYVVNKFKTIARNIKKENNVFIGDFKAGIDNKIYFEYGEIIYENHKPPKVINYDYDLVIEKLKQFRNNKWITEIEYKKIRKMTKSKNITVLDFYNLYYEIRDLYLARWTINEIILGHKILRSGDKLTLEDAITHDSIVKIDILAPINMKYTEVTNFFYLILEDSNGKETVINKELGDYIESLDKEILHYSSITFRNSLKLAKKLWIKHNLLKNENVLKNIYPLFYSGAAHLNQIKAETETIQLILEKYINKTSPDIVKNFNIILPLIINQLDEFKKRINDIHDVKFNTEKLYQTLDIINKNITKKQEYKTVIKTLEKFITLLKPIIESHSVNYLNNKGIVKLRKVKAGIDDKMKDDIDVQF